MVLLMLFNDREQSYKVGLWIGNWNEMACCNQTLNNRKINLRRHKSWDTTELILLILCGDNIYGIASGASLLVILQSDFL